MTGRRASLVFVSLFGDWCLHQLPNKLTNTKLARWPVIVVYIITDSGLVVNHGVISSQLLAVNVCTSKYVADYYSTSDEKWLLWPGQQLSLSTVNTVQYNRCISVTVSSRTMMQSSRPGLGLEQPPGLGLEQPPGQFFGLGIRTNGLEGPCLGLEVVDPRFWRSLHHWFLHPHKHCCAFHSIYTLSYDIT